MKRQQLLGILLLAIAIMIILIQFNVIALPFVIGDVPLPTLFYAGVLVYLLVKGILNRQLEVIVVCTYLLIYAFNHIWYTLPISFGLGIVITILIYYGLRLILPKKERHLNIKVVREKTNSQKKVEQYKDNFHVRFGKKHVYLNAEEYNTVKTITTLGELQLFFDNVDQSVELHTIDANVTLGEMIVFVPKEWQVVNNVNVILGDVNVKGTSGNTNNQVTLYINGSVTLGELQIVYI